MAFHVINKMMTELILSSDETFSPKQPILLDSKDFLTLSPEEIIIPSPTRRPIPFPIPRPITSANVPGKEYSDNADRTSSGTPDPGQTLLWNGIGVTKDGIDYPTYGQVDAMANPGDAFFDGIMNDSVALVFSTTFEDKIFFELPRIGSGGIWSKANQINSQGVDDVDALELWGPQKQPDAFYYSVYGDATIDPLTGVVVAGAVFDQSNNVIFTNQEITKAVNKVTQLNLRTVNLDAMMVSRDEIIFSVDSIEGLLDGGEIFVYDQSTGNSAFLEHGGHLWDTNFNVMKTFGTTSENINALEAVPLQTSIIDPRPGEAVAINTLDLVN